MNRGSITRGRRARIDLRYEELMRASHTDVARLYRALGLMLFPAKTKHAMSVRICRWYKRNPQPKRMEANRERR